MSITPTLAAALRQLHETTQDAEKTLMRLPGASRVAICVSDILLTKQESDDGFACYLFAHRIPGAGCRLCIRYSQDCEPLVTKSRPGGLSTINNLPSSDRIKVSKLIPKLIAEAKDAENILESEAIEVSNEIEQAIAWIESMRPKVNLAEYHDIRIRAKAEEIATSPGQSTDCKSSHGGR